MSVDLDDEPAKLRRNTLAISLVVVVSFFLDLSVPQTLFGVKIPDKSDAKIFALVALTSAYLFLRYYNSDEAERARAVFYVQFGVRRNKVLVRNINFLMLIRKKIAWLSFPFIEKFISTANQTLRLRVEQDLDSGHTVIAIRHDARGVGEYGPEGDEKIAVSFSYKDRGGMDRVAEILTECQFPVWFRMFVFAECWIRSLLHNSTFVNFLFPYVLFFFSTLCLTIRSYQYLFPHYSLFMGSIKI